MLSHENRQVELAGVRRLLDSEIGMEATQLIQARLLASSLNGCEHCSVGHDWHEPEQSFYAYEDVGMPYL